MTEIKKPEELAFAATKMIADAATKLKKERLVLTYAAAAISVGIIVATPTTVIPFSLFGAAYGAWDMYRTRKASLKLRDTFNDVSEHLGEHDSVHQMDPMKRAFDKVTSYGKDDLNVMAHFRRDKYRTVAMGAVVLVNPLLAPMALSFMISNADSRKLKAVEESIKEVQKNFHTKYPLTFDKHPEI